MRGALCHPALFALGAAALGGCYDSHLRGTDVGVAGRDGGRDAPGRPDAPTTDARRADAPDARCMPETCNATDDDCDGAIDEDVCTAHGLAISVGGGAIRDAACLLDRSGRIACWGWNGDGMVDPHGGPEAIPRPRWLEGVEDARSVDVGGYVACARTGSGEAWCWGTSVGSERGDAMPPTRIDALFGVTDLAVTSSGFCGIVAGAVICDDGAPWSEPARPQPIGAVVGLDGLVAVGISPWNAFVVDGDGGVTGWGLNYEGELGSGTTGRRDTPGPVALGAPAVEVCTGNRISCARDVDGHVWCWGAGGRVGDGTEERRPTPVRLELEGVVAIGCGSGYACAADGEGAAWCWGWNGTCGLGDGSREARTAPVRVLLDDVVDIDAGSTTTCAVRRDGSAWCWGDNHNGAVGDGTTDGDFTDGWTWPRTHPTRVLLP